MFVNALIGTLFVPDAWDLMQRFQEKYLAKYFKVLKPKPNSDNTDDESDDTGGTPGNI